MSVVPAASEVQPLREAIPDRLRQVERRLDSLADEIAANQREYESLGDSRSAFLSRRRGIRIEIVLPDVGNASAPGGLRATPETGRWPDCETPAYLPGGLT